MDSELKPCPFCGGKPSVVWFDGFPSVRCGDCLNMTAMHVGQTDKEAKNAAVAAWNRRSADTHAADERQAEIVAWLRENAEQLGDDGYLRWVESDDMGKHDCRASGEHTALLIADAIERGDHWQESGRD